jgi:hypothetical protein
MRYRVRSYAAVSAYVRSELRNRGRLDILERKERRSIRGMGRIFKRGPIYWIAYYHRGKEFRESSYSESEKEARRLLKKRIGEVGTGRFTGGERNGSPSMTWQMAF